MIVDNFSRRRIDLELNSNSLTRIADIDSRVNAANVLVGDVDYRFIDIAKQYNEFKTLVEQYRPDTIVHFAEQRAKGTSVHC